MAKLSSKLPKDPIESADGDPQTLKKYKVRWGRGNFTTGTALRDNVLSTLIASYKSNL